MTLPASPVAWPVPSPRTFSTERLLVELDPARPMLLLTPLILTTAPATLFTELALTQPAPWLPPLRWIERLRLTLIDLLTVPVMLLPPVGEPPAVPPPSNPPTA